MSAKLKIHISCTSAAEASQKKLRLLWWQTQWSIIISLPLKPSDRRQLIVWLVHIRLVDRNASLLKANAIVGDVLWSVVWNAPALDLLPNRHHKKHSTDTSLCPPRLQDLTSSVSIRSQSHLFVSALTTQTRGHKATTTSASSSLS